MSIQWPVKSPMSPSLSYKFLRPLLFAMPPEFAHSLAIDTLRIIGKSRIAWPVASDDPREAVSLIGLRFPNRVGIAAGFDKNGVCADGLAAIGFGFAAEHLIDGVIATNTTTQRPADSPLRDEAGGMSGSSAARAVGRGRGQASPVAAGTFSDRRGRRNHETRGCFAHAGCQRRSDSALHANAYPFRQRCMPVTRGSWA